MILFLVVFGMLVTIGFLVAAAISDFRSMTIPNIYAGGILLAFIPAFLADAFTGHGMEFFYGWQSHLIAALAVFAISFLLFSLRVIGAGDSKLATAVALWVGLSGMTAFLFYMAIAGAVLAIATKFMNGKQIAASPKEASWIAQSQAGRLGVPYGIAICFGAIVAFYQLDYFSPEKLALLAGYTENQP